MKKALFSIFTLGLIAGFTATTQAATVTYGWEDGIGTVLSLYGDIVDPMNVTGPQTGLSGSLPTSVPGANSGSNFLHVAEAPHNGTPQVYLGFITGLKDGDDISAGFFGYDDTATGGPSLRIWAHWANSADVMSYVASAGGNNTYTDGSGWGLVSYNWNLDASLVTADALVIEARLYSTPATDAAARSDYWIDDLTITAPDSATIITPGGTTSPAPIPAAAWLLGSGLITLAGLKRRREEQESLC